MLNSDTVTETVSGTAPSETQQNPDQPWHLEDGRPLSALLGVSSGPGSSSETCSWSLGRLDPNNPDTALAAWRIASFSVEQRATPAIHSLWESTIRAGGQLSARDARRLDAFLHGGCGPPSNPAPDDHLQGHVAEMIWHFLTRETRDTTRTLATLEPPDFHVTSPGGDGLAIWQADSGLFFTLWEVKKHTGARHISRTISAASSQLDAHAEEYLAKFSAVGSRRHSGQLGTFYAQLLDLWVDDAPEAHAGISISTSEQHVPTRRSFGSFVRTFPAKAQTGRLEGLIVAPGDFARFANAVREWMWSAH